MHTECPSKVSPLCDRTMSGHSSTDIACPSVFGQSFVISLIVSYALPIAIHEYFHCYSRPDFRNVRLFLKNLQKILLQLVQSARPCQKVFVHLFLKVARVRRRGAPVALRRERNPPNGVSLLPIPVQRKKALANASAFSLVHLQGFEPGTH